MREEVA
jgi:hypothetical protein